MRKLRFNLFLAALAVVLVVVAGSSGVARAIGDNDRDASKPAEPPTEKAILFAADGMRPDLVDRYAAQGRDAHDEGPDARRA